MSVESLKDTKQKIVEPKKMGLLVENPVYKLGFQLIDPFFLALQFFVLYLLDFLLT